LIRWLEAQLGTLRQPEGILLLDDLVGMVSRRTYEKMVEPHLKRIFDHFSGMLRIYHNDMPCPHLLESLSQAGFDVFNFSHKTDIALVKEKMAGRVALMGNVAPLDLVSRHPEQSTLRQPNAEQSRSRRWHDPFVWRRRFTGYAARKYRGAAGSGARLEVYMKSEGKHISENRFFDPDPAIRSVALIVS
jgi:hypothetical protein